MHSYLTFRRQITPKSWKGKVLFGLFLLILIGGAFLLFDWAIWRFQVRYLLLTFLATAVLLTIGMVIEKRWILKDADTASKERMKFHAEIFAGCALLGFAGQFFHLGATLDHLLPNNRLSGLSDLGDEVRALAGCADPQPRTSCLVVRSDLLKLEQALISVSEPSVTEHIASIKHQLQLANRSNSRSRPPRYIDQTINKLDALDRSDFVLTRVVQTLPVFALLFACLAISSKVALAWQTAEAAKQKSDALRNEAVRAATAADTNVSGPTGATNDAKAGIAPECGTIGVAKTIAIVAIIVVARSLLSSERRHHGADV